MTDKKEGKALGFFRSRIRRLFRPTDKNAAADEMQPFSSDVSGMSQTNLDSSLSSCSSGASFGGETGLNSMRLIEDSIRQDEWRRLLLKFCGQSQPEAFEHSFPSEKYAEVGRFETGTYAEVFRGIHAPTGESAVFKVIRAVPQSLPKKALHISLRGCETFEDILREVRITRKLCKLDQPHPNLMCPSFPRVFSVKLVRGRIPMSFFEREIEGKPSNLSPPRREPFDGYPGAPIEHLVLAMADAGEPLWKMFKQKKLSGYQVISIAKQVAFALAIAESAYEFEHRDLHNSNILIRETSSRYIVFCLNGISYQLECCGVIAFIIDNTFSRYKINNSVSYKDMTETLRPQKDGEEKMTLQNKAYIKMVEETGNDWKSYWPRTNVFWLYYLFKTMSNDSVMQSPAGEFAANQMNFLISILVRSRSARDAVSLMLNSPGTCST